MKYNKIFTYFFTLGLSAILWSSCGCTQTAYSPSGARHLPLQEKNDFQIATDFNGLQIGYSPFKHLGIQSSFFNRKRKLNHFETGDLFYCDRENLIMDIAFGGYHSFLLKNRNQVENVLLSAYVGYGQGKITSEFKDASSYKFEYQNYFQQLGIQYLAPRFQIGYFFKREVNDLNKGKFVFGEEPFDSPIEFNAIADSDLDNYYFSTLKVAFQLDPIWLFANATLSHQLESNSLFFPESIIQAGFAIDINDIFKKFNRKK